MDYDVATDLLNSHDSLPSEPIASQTNLPIVQGLRTLSQSDNQNLASNQLAVSVAMAVSQGRGSFESDGLRLHWQAQRPDECTAVVVMVHGIGEHCDRYASLTEPLSANGIAVYSYDLRGHGRSGGTPGHIDSWDDYLRDLLTFVEFVSSLETGKPLFLFGHSMGALIALDFAVQCPTLLQGVIINGVPLRPGSVAKSSMVWLAKIMSVLNPTYSVDLGLDRQFLSSNPDVVRAYQADPLVRTKVTARWGTSILGAIERVRGSAVNLQVPILMTHGKQDLINLPAGTIELFGTIPTRDKTFRIYEGSRHEVHNDLDAHDFATDVCDWIMPRANPNSL
jgi:alpha-beta hydrolase superfamily lysophospholipase